MNHNDQDDQQNNINQRIDEQERREIDNIAVGYDSQTNKMLSQYKRKLIFAVSGVFTICIILIIERIFDEKLDQYETVMISSFQRDAGLVTFVQDEGFVSFKPNAFFTFFGYLSYYEVYLLLLTHFLISLYVGINGLVGVRLTYILLICQFFDAVLRLIYGGPRPYWQSGEIATSVCVKTFSMPSNDVYMLLLIIFYTDFCLRQINGQKDQPYSLKRKIILVVISIFAVGFFFIKWMIGQIFISAMVIGTLYFVFTYYILTFFDKYIDDLIKKSTVQSYDAKKYVFSWFFACILAELIATMFFSGSEDYLSIEWVQNYIFCEKRKDNLPDGIPYNELIGPWFTFLVTTCIYALLASIFGIAHCFRHIGEFEWYLGTTKQKAIRIIIANLFMIPSWLIVIFQNDILNTQWIRLSGLNEYFFNAFHFFFLYFFLFGLMPLYIFKKFKLIPQTNMLIEKQMTQLSALKQNDNINDTEMNFNQDNNQTEMNFGVNQNNDNNNININNNDEDDNNNNQKNNEQEEQQQKQKISVTNQKDEDEELSQKIKQPFIEDSKDDE